MNLASLLQPTVDAGAEEQRLAPGRAPVIVTAHGVSELDQVGELVKGSLVTVEEATAKKVDRVGLVTALREIGVEAPGSRA